MANPAQVRLAPITWNPPRLVLSAQGWVGLSLSIHCAYLPCFSRVFVSIAQPPLRSTNIFDIVQYSLPERCVGVSVWCTSRTLFSCLLIRCAKRLHEWGEGGVPESERMTFFEALGCDLEIIKTVLLLTGALHGTTTQVSAVVEGGCVCVGKMTQESLAAKRQVEKYNRLGGSCQERLYKDGSARGSLPPTPPPQ